MHEAQLHELSCFVTLTYNNDQVPPGQNLRYRDFQLFMKRTRKKFSGQLVRFYMCGEYGERFTRPHYHACLFGIDFPDKEPITQLASQAKLFKSATLDTLWPHGYASVGAVTFQSAAYVARYVMKKITGDLAEAHYTYVDEHGEIHNRTPEFNHMSLRPGIGARWFEQFKNDVYPSDQVITNGHPGKPPRYYDKLHERLDAAAQKRIRQRRDIQRAEKRADNTPRRLAAKEQVATARASLLKRTIT